MKYRILATLTNVTPMATIEGEPTEMTEKQLKALDEMLQEPMSKFYFRAKSGGTVYFPEEVLKHCVIEVQPIK